MSTIKVKDRYFKPLISEAKIAERIAEIAAQIKVDFGDKKPVFLPVLNGSFMFAADLMKVIQWPCEIEFINAKSYAGTASTGVVKVETYFKKPMENRHLIIIEDIVDTGRTMDKLLKILAAEQPASISVASLLVKPDNLEIDIDVRYFGFKIANEFVVGYGLDYDGMGRNLLAIYQETSEKE